MNPTLHRAIALIFAAGLSTTAIAGGQALSGILPANMDQSIRIQDDFFKHVNGTWIKNTEIPADKTRWGAFNELRDNALSQLKTIIEDNVQHAKNADARKIADLYTSFMDEARLNTLGLKPLEGEFARVNGLQDKQQLAALIAHFTRVGVNVPLDLNVHQDAKDSTRYVVDLQQSGLGLPDRDYYLNDDARMQDFRAKYVQHIEKMLKLAGDAEAAKKATDIMAFETELAKIQWSKVELRDPVKGYNKVPFAELPKLAANLQWTDYLKTVGVADKTDYVIVGQPNYVGKLNDLLNATSLDTLKTYFNWKILSSYASFLSKDFDQENFAFNDATLSGQKEQEPRWKRAVNLENADLGEALGKQYTAKYFPPENKQRMEKLVANLLKAYKQSIDKIDWMSPQTKKEAQDKLASFTTKIGYPSKWRDYSSLTISKDDLVGNVMRANEFELVRNISKIGKPIDRTEWGMTPQTVNAYYNPEMNEIVFPAAILQPPFFNSKADDAVNYGGIGAVIGHEISHGFDDQGSQYDGKGNLRDWWTKEDHEKFGAKTAALVKQYSSYSPVPNYNVNGELTLGENIADNSGLAIAYKAYKLSLNGKKAPVIDGMTGEQRFYTGFGQVWRGKSREEALIKQVKTDPHSPAEFRGNGTVVNQPGFYEAFGVKPGDKMYVAPEQRVIIW